MTRDPYPSEWRHLPAARRRQQRMVRAAWLIVAVVVAASYMWVTVIGR